ncbi:replication-associated protein [Trichonephila clavata]|uniref:Replication-associated protein n=1 Tax=Trichonephila clavata TaxID=2740835 RepID=A0A8X6KV75_TRICU|nr:replication-associated protein [Trichonephila clavata]
MGSRQYAKRWTFTINNPWLNDHPSLWLINTDSYGFQYERGTNNTPHIQGFVIFSERRSLQQVKKMQNQAHWEIMKGSIKQNVEYCSKEEGKLSGDPLVMFFVEINSYFG